MSKKKRYVPTNYAASKLGIAVASVRRLVLAKKLKGAKRCDLTNAILLHDDSNWHRESDVFVEEKSLEDELRRYEESERHHGSPRRSAICPTCGGLYVKN